MGLAYDDRWVRWTLIEPVLGGVPKDPAVYQSYIASLAPAAEMGAEELATVPPAADVAEQRGWTGFHTDEAGQAFVYNYAILGYLRDAGNILKEQAGVKNLRSKLENFLYVLPRRIYLHGEPGGVLERPLRAMTAMGPRVTLARSDTYSTGTTLDIHLRLLGHKQLDWQLVATLLDLGELHGFGRWRTGGWGAFRWTWIDEPEEG